jgi:predicted lipoprotein with Yx(FWY)xxD motif
MRSALLSSAVLVLILAACAGPAATPTPAPSAAPTAAPTAAPSAAPSAAAGTVQLASSSLGQILVDGAGKTLYGFTPDEDSGQSTCYDQCADNWPALTVSGAFTVGAGLNQADFTTVTRTDGGTQLKFKEYPLYYFAGDTGAGQTNGQGVGTKWYVIGVEGELIK